MKNGFITYKDFAAELKIRQRNDSIHAKNAKKLKKYFTFKKDEFDQYKRTWVTPNDAPKYSNRNGFYCYFQLINGRASNLRLKIQYCSDDWLFIQKFILSSGDQLHEYIPSEIERDCGDGKIWEWTDEIVRPYSTYPALKAISENGGGKIKIDGNQYYKTKEIMKSQALSIKRTLELYEALGGEL